MYGTTLNYLFEKPLHFHFLSVEYIDTKTSSFSEKEMPFFDDKERDMIHLDFVQTSRQENEPDKQNTSNQKIICRLLLLKRIESSKSIAK